MNPTILALSVGAVGAVSTGIATHAMTVAPRDEHGNPSGRNVVGTLAIGCGAMAAILFSATSASSSGAALLGGAGFGAMLGLAGGAITGIATLQNANPFGA